MTSLYLKRENVKGGGEGGVKTTKNDEIVMNFIYILIQPTGIL